MKASLISIAALACVSFWSSACQAQYYERRITVYRSTSEPRVEYDRDRERAEESARRNRELAEESGRRNYELARLQTDLTQVQTQLTVVRERLDAAEKRLREQHDEYERKIAELREKYEKDKVVTKHTTTVVMYGDGTVSSSGSKDDYSITEEDGNIVIKFKKKEK